MIQLFNPSERKEIKVDGEHGWQLADYVDREPREGEYVKVEQCFAFADGDSFGVESIPEPVRIVKVAARPGKYWGAQHPAGSYDFRERCRLSRGRRLVQTHSSEGGHVQFHDADDDQSGVRKIYKMNLWGRMQGGKIVPADE